jgi:hypothetical protein
MFSIGREVLLEIKEVERLFGGDHRRDFQQDHRKKGKSLNVDLPWEGLGSDRASLRGALRPEQVQVKRDHRKILLLGRDFVSHRIEGLSGIGISFDEAYADATCVHSIAQGCSVEWFICSSEGLTKDLSEGLIFSSGQRFSKMTALMRSAWDAFDQAHRLNPTSGLLHISVGPGAKLTYEALQARLPERVRTRIHVLAIAPSIHIPSSLCASIEQYVYCPETCCWRFYEDDVTTSSEPLKGGQLPMHGIRDCSLRYILQARIDRYLNMDILRKRSIFNKSDLGNS